METKRLYDLINMESPEAVLQETVTVLKMMFPDYKALKFTKVFHDTVKLYSGKRPGYCPCTTKYHDFQHSAETLLAQVRLAHGAVLEGLRLTAPMVELSLIAAILHDVGYVQEKNDAAGTGAKYTDFHELRSIQFMERYGAENAFSLHEIQNCQVMICCTDLANDFSLMLWPSREVELLGKMLGAADLLAQLADRTHLEKLIYLHEELMEGRAGSFDSPEALLRNTSEFYALVDMRLSSKLEHVDRFMSSHFKARWNIDADLYRVAMENEKAYLQKIIQQEDTEILKHLRRKGIIQHVVTRIEKVEKGLAKKRSKKGTKKSIKQSRSRKKPSRKPRGSK